MKEKAVYIDSAPDLFLRLWTVAVMVVQSCVCEVVRQMIYVVICADLLAEGVKMRGTKSSSDVNRHSADQTVSTGVPYRLIA